MCLALCFIIITALSLLIYFGSKPIDRNQPIILISAEETVGLSDEDIISILFTKRLQYFSSIQDFKITNVKKRIDLNNKISFDVGFKIKPYPDAYTHWSAGASTHYEDNWLGKAEEVELIKEDNRYRIEIVGP